MLIMAALMKTSIAALVLFVSVTCSASEITPIPQAQEMVDLKASLILSCSTAELTCLVESFSLLNGFTPTALKELLAYQYAEEATLGEFKSHTDNASILVSMFLMATLLEAKAPIQTEQTKDSVIQALKTLNEQGATVHMGETYSAFGNHKVMYFVIGNELLSITAGYSE